MSEAKKLTPEEIQDIKTIQEKHQILTYEIGEIDILIETYRTSMEDAIEKKRLLYTDRNSLLERDQILAQKLSDKYGEGTINIDAGEIIQK